MKWILYLGVAGHRKWLVAVGLLALVVAAEVGHDHRRRVDASPKSKPVPVRVMVDAVGPRRATLHRNIEQPGPGARDPLELAPGRPDAHPAHRDRFAQH